MDKERSMALLANLVDGEADRSMSVGAEALLTLSGVAPLMEDCSKEVPAGCDGAPVDGPSWALCVSCGRARQTKRWLPVWWRFTCGDPEATNPRLTCRDSSTFSPTKCVLALHLLPAGLHKREGGGRERERLHPCSPGGVSALFSAYPWLEDMTVVGWVVGGWGT